jgi:hypothetical protein
MARDGPSGTRTGQSDSRRPKGITRTVRENPYLCLHARNLAGSLPLPAPVRPVTRLAPTCIDAGVAAGSSPHARGTRRNEHGADHPNRFIPACPGNTLAAASASVTTNMAGGWNGCPRDAMRPRSRRAERLSRRFHPAIISCAQNMRRLFPGITDNAKARLASTQGPLGSGLNFRPTI